MAYNKDFDQKQRQDEKPVDPLVKVVNYFIRDIRNNFEAMIQVRVAGNNQPTACERRFNYKPLTSMMCGKCNEKYNYMRLQTTGEVIFIDEDLLYQIVYQLLSDVKSWLNIPKEVYDWVKKISVSMALSAAICDFYYNCKNWGIPPLSLISNPDMLNQLLINQKGETGRHFEIPERMAVRKSATEAVECT